MPTRVMPIWTVQRKRSGALASANADNALALMLVGVGLLLPVILGYTIWVYWLFRGKVGAHAGYH